MLSPAIVLYVVSRELLTANMLNKFANSEFQCSIENLLLAWEVAWRKILVMDLLIRVRLLMRVVEN